jgi:hypothetical protein
MKRKPAKKVHTKSGNCFAGAYSCTTDGCRKGTLCDVCHEHSMPRGECDECPTCRACESGAPVKGAKS